MTEQHSPALPINPRTHDWRVGDRVRIEYSPSHRVVIDTVTDVRQHTIRGSNGSVLFAEVQPKRSGAQGTENVRFYLVERGEEPDSVAARYPKDHWVWNLPLHDRTFYTRYLSLTASEREAVETLVSNLWAEGKNRLR